MTIEGAWVQFRLRQARAHGHPVSVRARPDAVVSELATALGHDPAHGLLIDGRRTRPHDELRDVGLYQGSVVAAAAAPAATKSGCGAAAAGPTMALVVCSGLSAGRTLALEQVERLIGRSPACDLVIEDPAVELLHAAIGLLEDGTAIMHLLGEGPPVLQPDSLRAEHVVLSPGQRFTIGATELELRTLRHPDRLASTDTVTGFGTAQAAPVNGAAAVATGPAGSVTRRGTLVLNRPPRVGAPQPPAALPPPRRPPPSSASPLAVAAIVLPLLVAAVLVTVTGSWLFALLTVLSPLLAVANWWSSRRAHRRSLVSSGIAFSRQLRQFEEAANRLRARHDREVAQRAVDLAEIARRALLPARTLWERRPEDHDGLRLLLGWAERPWTVPLTTTEGLEDPAVATVLARVQRPTWGPVELHLGQDPVVGLVGDLNAARAVARSLLVQLAVHHGPADVATVAVAPQHCGVWDWLGWLPHALFSAPEPEPGLVPSSTGGNAATGATELAQLLRRRHNQRTAAPQAHPLEPRGVPGSSRHLVMLVDDEATLLSRGSPIRSVLRGELGPPLALLLVSSADHLPASCGVVIELGPGGVGRVRTMRDGSVIEGVQLMGAAPEVALDVAATLARYEDPELALPGSDVPDRVGLLELLLASGTLPGSHENFGPDTTGRSTDGQLDAVLVDAVIEAWSGGDRTSSGGGLDELPAVLGSGAHGPTVVDLVADGPHALVAGTTGAGKSELLRSWILALAAATSPERLNFVLIDFKGGSAFDACSRLPHTVAVVTDLDAELAERALRCLQAELAHRERVLRQAGVSDIAELGRLAVPDAGQSGAATALARLVVVIDEFATLAAELPGFVDSLVGIAQRGRSLGLHLILATQRPAGVVNDNIRANTNIRIALRVQDRADSLDVIEQPDAANLDRQRPGRAVVRLGRNELVEIQTAFSGAVGEPGTTPAVQRLDQPHIVPAAAVLAAVPASTVPAADLPRRTDLDRLVDVTGAAARHRQLASPRVPWPPALPSILTWRAWHQSRSPDGPMVPFVLVDDPDRQLQEPGGWEPGRGNLVVFGAAGSGVSSALVALCLALADQFDPGRLALHILGDDPAFVAVARLPHVVNLIGRSDRERFGRLLAALEAEISCRRAAAAPASELGESTSPLTSPSPSELVVWVIDGLGSLLAELSEPAAASSSFGGGGAEDVDRLTRLMVDGPSVGLYVLAGANHPGALRHRILSALPQRLVLRLTDPLDARQLGVAPTSGPPGRGRLGECGRAFQVLSPEPLADLVATVARRYQARRPDLGTAQPPHRQPVQRLAEQVPVSWLESAPSPRQPDPGAQIWLPIGIGGMDLRPSGWWLRPGEGVLVAGPSRSGRSTALLTMAAILRARRPDVSVVGVSSSRSPLSRGMLAAHLQPHQLVDLLADPVPVGDPGDGNAASPAPVLLVDDVESVEDPSAVVASLLAAGWVVIGAGRTDALRSAYGHWTRALRTAQSGLLLRADRDLDGDLLGVRLPRRTEAPLDAVGRGFLVCEGVATVLQTARPESSSL